GQLAALPVQRVGQDLRRAQQPGQVGSLARVERPGDGPEVAEVLVERAETDLQVRAAPDHSAADLPQRGAGGGTGAGVERVQHR
ncbi:hypothetical protein, partial [Mycobacterium tuberculosis]